MDNLVLCVEQLQIGDWVFVDNAVNAKVLGVSSNGVDVSGVGFVPGESFPVAFLSLPRDVAFFSEIDFVVTDVHDKIAICAPEFNNGAPGVWMPASVLSMSEVFDQDHDHV
ncbi:hypothetical protein [Actinomyces vulturis]|uniref:hypothetical protein n=1 Tax=Actinomyces vulturis TaxID=1857645 RepID=UPI000835CBE8|nr:hypothetical protein [Actinomyces vulturis]